MPTKNHTIFFTPLAFICNLALVYIAYGICRMAYLFENWKALSGALDNGILPVLKGCWMFDTSAILYTNALYALLLLFPLHLKEKDCYRKVVKWVYVVINSLCLIINLCDVAYFQYTGRRTTTTIFSEFTHENNLGGVLGTEILRHWYLVVLGILLIWALVALYVQPKGSPRLKDKKGYLKYYSTLLISLGIFVPLCIGGMRGGFTTATRPITVADAMQYVNNPSQAALVLNTPFSLIRTINKNVFSDPGYYSAEELNRIYSPIHLPADSVQMKRKNVVILIVESFGREYIGSLNRNTKIKDYKGYTPFIDSLMTHSVTFDYSFSNGRKSVDGMPSVLAGIPRFVEPFVLTPASMNKVSGIAGELKKTGYYTAFFHGAENGSMGFEAFSRSCGYQDYFGRTEYNEDKRFNGDKDFDGMWAIWDEEFLQFYARKMSEMKEPFATTVFTASSHHPYAIPDRYKDVYKDEPGDGNPIHKCIRYVDHALRLFFETAQKQPWYKNTLFVITADHTNLSSYGEYQTELGLVSAPILFFDPSGELQPKQHHALAQHIDIMPTVLGYLGYNQPYVAFGHDLFHTPDEDSWMVGYDTGTYFYAKGNHVIFYSEDNQLKGIYNFKNDWALKQNLKGQTGETEKQMTRELKAIIQSYMQRMITDSLVADRQGK